MDNEPGNAILKRMIEIEDRKIEILMELAKINDQYDKIISKLNSEYIKLDKEHYPLKLLSVRNVRGNG